jgi:hypothetical protein
MGVVAYRTFWDSVVEVLEEVFLFTDTVTAIIQRFRVFFEFETTQSRTRLNDCGCTEWLKRLALNESLTTQGH